MRRALAVSLFSAISAILFPLASGAGAARPGWTKAVLQPAWEDVNVTSAHVTAIGAEMVRQYEAFTEVTLPAEMISKAVAGAAALGLDLQVEENWDKVITPGGATVDTRAPVLPQTGLVKEYPGGVGLFLVQWDGPLVATMAQDLKDHGLRYLGYLPYNAALVFGRAADLARLSERPDVQWTSIYHPAFRHQPKGTPVDDSPQDFVVQLVDDPGNEPTLGRLRSAATVPATTSQCDSYTDVRVRVPSSLILGLRADPYVVAAELAGLSMVSGEREAIAASSLRLSPPTPPEPYQDGTQPFRPGSPPTPDYRAWLSARGVSQTQAYLIAFADTGLAAAHPDIVASGGRTINSTNYTNRPVVYDENSHGTAVIGLAAGNPADVSPLDPQGFHWAMGLTPTASIFSQKVADDMGRVQFTVPPITWANDAFNWGCTVQTHSWNQYPDRIGDPFDPSGDVSGLYSLIAREFDVFVRDTYAGDGADTQLPVTVSAGNICQGGLVNGVCPTMVLPPGTSKNVLSVGGSEAWRLPTGDCQLTYADPSLKNVGFRSRRGTLDGRIKPDILAPGFFASSARLAGAGSCNQTGGSPPPDNYMVGIGTSYSAPQAAAAYVLLSRRRETVVGQRTTLSPAMLKAAIVGNSLSVKGGIDRCKKENFDSCSVGSVPARPNMVQGFGRLYLGDALGGSGTPTQTYLDEGSWAPFTGAGQTRSRTMAVVDRSKPAVIVVAWTDEPGTAYSNPCLVRDIDMWIQWFPKWHTGNKMTVEEYSQEQSSPTYDRVNNVEMIVIRPGTLSTFVLRLRAYSWGFGSHEQRFAVFAANAQ